MIPNIVLKLKLNGGKIYIIIYVYYMYLYDQWKVSHATTHAAIFYHGYTNYHCTKYYVYKNYLINKKSIYLN